MPTRDQRNFTRPDLTKKRPDAPIDLEGAKGTGTPADDHGAEERDFRSAQRYAEGHPGTKIPALPPSGGRQRE